MSDPAPDPVDDRVEVLVLQLYGIGGLRRDLARSSHGEVGAQGFTALAMLYVHGPLRIGRLAHLLAIDVSVASRQAAALVESGLATTAPDPSDRRAQLLSLSAAGDDCLRAGHRRTVDAVRERLERHEWGAERITSLTGLLGDLLRAFDIAPPTVDDEADGDRSNDGATRDEEIR